MIRNDSLGWINGLRLRGSPLVAEGTSPIPAAHVGFDPAVVDVAPGGAVTVVVTLAVPCDAVPGTYVGLIHAVGSVEARVLLSVDVA